MADIVNSQTRSRMMAGIRGKDTKPELALRRALHALGFRYRLHVKGLPGTPDIVMPKYNAVIFIHGCFWHRHRGCRYATSPSTRRDFWTAKFDANLARDTAVRSALLQTGWRVATVWECALKTEARVALVGDVVAAWLRDGGSEIEVGESAVEKSGV